MLPPGLLAYELHRQWKLRRVFIAMLAQVLLLALLLIVLDAAQLGRPLDTLLYALTCLMLLVSPPIAAVSLSPRHQASGMATSHVLLAKWISSVSRPFLFLLVTECLTLPLVAGVHWSTLWIGLRAYLVLSSYLAFGSALGLLCRLGCSRLTYAVQLAYAIIGLLLTNVFWFSPLVSNDLSRWIPIVLQSNPFVALSAILRTDLFRTPYLYDASRITDYSYAYPKWYWASIWYLLAALFTLVLASWVLKVVAGRNTENFSK